MNHPQPLPHLILPPRHAPAPTAAPALPLAALLLLALLWLIPGLVGHEPWKPDEAYTFGLVRHIAASGDWVVPMLAGEPFMEKPPLFFISAAWFLQAFSGWLPPPDAARLAAGFWMALALAGTAMAARASWGKGWGRWAVVILLGCLGLPLRAHQLITDTALLAGCAWALAGLSLARTRPRAGGLLLGAGVAIGFLSKGLLLPGCAGLAALLLPLHPAWRTRGYLSMLGWALLAGLPLPLLWMGALYLRDPSLFQLWLETNNFGRFNGTAHLGPAASPFFYSRTLPWYAFPALPLALFGLWRLRRQRDQLVSQLPVALLAASLLAVLALAADARELYAMPLLPPLAVLALAALPAADNWRPASRLALLCALLLTGSLLTVASVLSGGPPQALQPLLWHKFSSGPPSFHPLVWIAFGVMVFIIVRLWRPIPAASGAGAAWRWALTLTLLWGGLSTLCLPAIDQGMRYRETFQSLPAALARLNPTGGCVASLNLGEGQRALLDYYAQLRTLRLETQPGARRCRLLLVQTLHDRLPDGRSPQQALLSFQRPGDLKERFWIFRQDAP